MESPDVRVPECCTVLISWGPAILVEEILLVVADIQRLETLVVGGWQARPRWRGGSFLGAVVLDHEVLDAMDSGVVGQVTPAGASRLASAVGVGA